MLVASQNLSNWSHTCLIDSGASCHFNPHHKNFIFYHSNPPKPVHSTDSDMFNATGEGDIHVTTSYEGKAVNFTLKNVLHTPTMPITLISVSQMVKGGFPAHFKQTSCKILQFHLFLSPLLPQNPLVQWLSLSCIIEWDTQCCPEENGGQWDHGQY